MHVSTEKPASLESKSPSKPRHDNAFCAETQSTRRLGDSKAEKRSLDSIDDVRQEPQRRDISAIVKRQLEAELLERMRTQYFAQVQCMVIEEMQRELEREVQLHLEGVEYRARAAVQALRRRARVLQAADRAHPRRV
ncbi:hypothetical protein FI667_g12633, partial [Globisporangium splendens]